MAFIGQHIVKIGSDFNYNPWAADVGKVELTPSGGPVHTDADHEGLLHTDEFGCVWDRRDSLPHPVAYPLGDVPDDQIAAALGDYPMPDPYHAGRFDSARQLADRYRAATCSSSASWGCASSSAPGASAGWTRSSWT